MGFFNYKKPGKHSYLDHRNPGYLTKKPALGAFKATANAGIPGIGGNGDQWGGSRSNQVNERLEEGSILEEWIPRQPTALHMMLRKIYLRDAISGTVVDTFSNLPWGKYYELIGLDDPKVLQMFSDMIEALNLWGELPMICREMQIIGRSISSLSFNERLGYWDSLITIDPDQARIQPLPVSGAKPLIDVLSSPSWREFARSVDPRVLELKQKMNHSTIELLQNQSGYFPLDPLNTLWLARRVNQYDHIGTSVFTRILPAWAYETALWNSSLIAVRRRTRAITLITAGVEDSWEPTDEEVASLVNMFQQADEDPSGGIVGVRNGVEVAEVRDPTNIWGISQEYEFLSMVKMRALGVSEAYLSGETNVSNMEAARTSLGKQINAFKEHVLREIFHKQLFPTFARIHNMQKRTQAELNLNIRTSGYNRAYITSKAAMDIPLDALLIPQLVTEDTLRPEQDTAYLDMLTTLKGEGIPVPLRIWASAAGYDLDKAISMMEEDAVLRQRLAQLGLGGAAGDEPADLGGADAPPDDGFLGDEGTSSPGGGGATLPPKWDNRELQASSKDAWEKMKTSKLINSLKKIDPRIIAEMRVPDSKAMVPYED